MLVVRAPPMLMLLLLLLHLSAVSLVVSFVSVPALSSSSSSLSFVASPQRSSHALTSNRGPACFVSGLEGRRKRSRRHNDGTNFSVLHDPISVLYRQPCGTSLASSSPSSSSYGSSSSSSSSSSPAVPPSMPPPFVSYLRRLSSSFIPRSTTPHYYPFMKWRFLHRFFSSNVHVLGTRSLLHGLGLSLSSSPSNLAAGGLTFNWLLRDVFGKLVRTLISTSSLASDFDTDAKRWKLRASLLYAAGSFFEISTCVPWCASRSSRYLIFACIGTSLKQVSLLASTSTRASINNSFRTSNVENVGDITAKGEGLASLADVLGVLSGLLLLRVIGRGPRATVLAYATLQSLELLSVSQEIKSVVFRTLNAERLLVVAKELCTKGTVPTPDAVARKETRTLLWTSKAQRPRDAFRVLPPSSSSCSSSSFFSAADALFSRSSFLPLADVNAVSGTFAPDDCYVVLHSLATDDDVLNASVALSLLREFVREGGGRAETSAMPRLLKAVRDELPGRIKMMKDGMKKAGWQEDRFMFGELPRTDWKLEGRRRHAQEEQQAPDRERKEPRKPRKRASTTPRRGNKKKATDQDGGE